MAAAPALAIASETERMALAPSLLLSAVPSRSLTMKLSSSTWLLGSFPFKAGEMISFTFLTALETPLPKYWDLSPSLN